jgi:DnaD/phage-associated family protein
LANLTKVSRRQVSRALKQLCDKGEIEYEPGDGRGNRSRYRITLSPKKDDTMSSYSQKDTLEKDDILSTKDDMVSKRMTSDTGKDDTMSSRTVIEPSIESNNNHKNGVVVVESPLANADSVSFSDVVRVYDNEMGGMSLTISQELEQAISDYGGQMVIDAMKQAAINNKRSWNYVRGILQNWHRNGKTAAYGKNKQKTEKTFALVDEHGNEIDKVVLNV